MFPSSPSFYPWTNDTAIGHCGPFFTTKKCLLVIFQYFLLRMVENAVIISCFPARLVVIVKFVIQYIVSIFASTVQPKPTTTSISFKTNSSYSAVKLEPNLTAPEIRRDQTVGQITNLSTLSLIILIIIIITVITFIRANPAAAQASYLSLRDSIQMRNRRFAPADRPRPRLKKKETFSPKVNHRMKETSECSVSGPSCSGSRQVSGTIVASNASPSGRETELRDISTGVDGVKVFTWDHCMSRPATENRRSEVLEALAEAKGNVKASAATTIPATSVENRGWTVKKKIKKRK